MVQFLFLLIVSCAIQLRALQYALIVAKNKRIMSSQRFLFSIIIFAIPVFGILLYHILKKNLKEKEYHYFSEEFVEKILLR
jgi:hypothetical protein